MPKQYLTRRRLVAVGSVGLIVGLAGCADGEDEDYPDPNDGAGFDDDSGDDDNVENGFDDDNGGDNDDVSDNANGIDDNDENGLDDDDDEAAG